MMSTVRGVALLGFKAFATSQGIDPISALAEVDLPEEPLNSNNWRAIQCVGPVMCVTVEQSLVRLTVRLAPRHTKSRHSAVRHA